MQYKLSKLAVILILFVIQRSQAVDWIDYDQSPSNIDLLYDDDDADQYLSALTRDDEQEIHSPIITGYKYVSGRVCFNIVQLFDRSMFCSGGAGEGRQHLSPNGEIPNRPEVKTDDELPSFCHPPNPCPLGFEGMCS